MRNNTSRILSLVLALVLVLSMVPTTAFAASTKTVYFQNNWQWTDVSVYYWGGSSTASWPGTKLTVVDKVGGYDIYKAEIPADSTGVIFNGQDSGTGGLNQTPDIKDSAIKSDVYYYMIWDGQKKVGTTAYAGPGVDVTDPSSEPSSEPDTTPTIPSGDDKVIYHLHKAFVHDIQYSSNLLHEPSLMLFFLH